MTETLTIWTVDKESISYRSTEFNWDFQGDVIGIMSKRRPAKIVYSMYNVICYKVECEKDGQMD